MISDSWLARMDGETDGVGTSSTARVLHGTCGLLFFFLFRTFLFIPICSGGTIPLFGYSPWYLLFSAVIALSVDLRIYSHCAASFLGLFPIHVLVSIILLFASRGRGLVLSCLASLRRQSFPPKQRVLLLYVSSHIEHIAWSYSAGITPFQG
ncbi:hypothetical protein VTK73DRAFT_8187 [Phialemonium thermophilum]|uniref:Uncharacterized protein n=1 Tax=Phialemonium thermophilum TaxID=223376 RepID=A0ABR3XRA1_9PEZI